jgi:hypothetical protein
MRHSVLMLSSLCLAAAMCAAQAVSGSGAGHTSATHQSESGAQTPRARQNRAGAGPDQQSTTTPDNSGANQTISGCLTASANSYSLTDAQTGTVYKLTGNTTQLSRYVGHEMQITGQPSNAGTARKQTGAPSGRSAGQNWFQVTGAQHLGNQCGSSSSTANGPAA